MCSTRITSAPRAPRASPSGAWSCATGCAPRSPRSSPCSGSTSATLLGGALLIEIVFDIPGVGRLNYDALMHADFPIIEGTVLLAALFIVVANILVDISYAYLDPRVRFKSRTGFVPWPDAPPAP